MISTLRFLLVDFLLQGAVSAVSAQDFQDLPQPSENVTAINCDLANEPFAQMKDGTIMSLGE